jgi:hypothetical protein
LNFEIFKINFKNLKIKKKIKNIKKIKNFKNGIQNFSLNLKRIQNFTALALKVAEKNLSTPRDRRIFFSYETNKMEL